MSSNSKTAKCHRDLYKTRTPPWKETYRKRCMDRLRDSREKLKAKFRRLDMESNQNLFIEELMKEEWKSLRAEHGKQTELDIEIAFQDFEITEDNYGVLIDCNQLWSFDVDCKLGGTYGQKDSSGFNDVDIDQVLSMFEDIQSELRQEEIRILKEFEIFEQSLHYEEKSLCSAVDKLTTDEVICPLCKRNPLLTNKTVIFCSCGMRINTEQDCLTLANVKTILDKGLEDHSQSCELEPSFSLISESPQTNLLMTCQSCDWMSIVI